MNRFINSSSRPPFWIFTAIKRKIKLESYIHVKFQLSRMMRTNSKSVLLNLLKHSNKQRNLNKNFDFLKLNSVKFYANTKRANIKLFRECNANTHICLWGLVFWSIKPRLNVNKIIGHLTWFTSSFTILRNFFNLVFKDL